MIVVQPHVETMPGEVGCVFRHHRPIGLLVVTDQQPTYMRPPGSVTWRMRVGRLVGFLMVNTMRGHPEDGSALQCEGAADSKAIFQPQRHLVGPVCVETVI